MNINLKKSGESLLNALSKHSDLIMQAYLSGSINESDFSPKIIQSLLDLKVLWRPESDVQLRLRPALRTLIEESLQDEHNRQIDANIGTLLATLKAQAEHYKEAMTSGRYSEAQAYLSDLTEHVYTLTETLSTNVRLLWSRIANEFGYVGSVDAKIRENELAQSQVSSLLDQLTMFRFDELSQLAGGYRELRHLLVVTLQSAFATATQELSLVQSKLIELLGRFRQFKGKTRLLRGFVLHMEQKPDFEPQNYTRLTKIPTLFNRAKSIIKPASVDVRNVEQENELQGILHSIKERSQVWSKGNQRNTASAIVVSDSETVSLQEDMLKRQVEQFFCDVIATGKNKSALQYYQEKEFEFEAEAWLYQVMGAYQGLPEQEREYIGIDTLGKYHATYTGNFIIDDIEIGLK
jgi:hypothetical protein